MKREGAPALLDLGQEETPRPGRQVAVEHGGHAEKKQLDPPPSFIGVVVSVAISPKALHGL